MEVIELFSNILLSLFLLFFSFLKNLCCAMLFFSLYFYHYSALPTFSLYLDVDTDFIHMCFHIHTHTHVTVVAAAAAKHSSLFPSRHPCLLFKSHCTTLQTLLCYKICTQIYLHHERSFHRWCGVSM